MKRRLLETQDSKVKHCKEARAVCVERRTYGSEGGKAREGWTYPVWVTKLTLDASVIARS